MLRVEYMCVCSRHNGANGWLLHQYVQRLPTAFVTQHAPNASIPTEHVFSCFPRHNCANGWLLHQHVQPMTTAFITNHALNVRTPIPDLWLFFPFEPWKNPNSRSWIWAWVYHISEGNTCTYIKRIKAFHSSMHRYTSWSNSHVSESLSSGNLKGYPWRYSTMWSFSMMRWVCFTGNMRHWDTLPGTESSSCRRYLYSMVNSFGSSLRGPTGPISPWDMSKLLVRTTLTAGNATW